MRRGALLVVAALVLAACGDDGDLAGDAAPTTERPTTTTTVAETTTTTAAPDPFTVPSDPADIDEAYVEAVLTELEHINGDALRLAVAEGLSPRITDLMRAIFMGETLGLQLQVLADDSARGFAGIFRPPGDVAVDVRRVNVARASCISADVDLDFTAVAEGGVAAAPTRVELRSRTPDAVNETPWSYLLRDPLDSTTGLPEQCAEA